MAKLIVGFNDLATVNPELAKQWHPTKNGDLKPTDVTACSGKKVWWYLPYDVPMNYPIEHLRGKHFDFEWESNIYSRTKRIGCPYLLKPTRVVSQGFNDLSTTHPEIAKEWHPTKNGDLKPTDVTAGSNQKVWWYLPYDVPMDYEVESLRGKHFDFEWKDTVKNRTNGSGCPFLSGHEILQGFNDLATVNPELAKQWHSTKNGDLKPTDVTACSGKKVWWYLPYDVPMNYPIEHLRGKHFDFEWESVIANRTNGNDCPYSPTASSPKAWKGFNDLETVNPKLAKQWHPTKNGDLKPTDVTTNCNQKVWWYLPYDVPMDYPVESLRGKHFNFEWEAVIKSRTAEIGCPYLADRKILQGFNDLATVNPELAKQWHPTKNGDLKPTDVTAGSGKKVWWYLPYDDQKTEKHFDFEWKAGVSHRTNGNGCPFLIVWKTEELVRALLSEYGIISEEQKRFHETGACRFDFYLPEYNIIIEPDGEQHFISGCFGSTEEDFFNAQKRDCLKNDFCLNNNIALLRIPYIFDPTKDEDKIKSMVVQFLQDKQVPEEILDFYREQKENSYYDIAIELNELYAGYQSPLYYEHTYDEYDYDY